METVSNLIRNTLKNAQPREILKIDMPWIKFDCNNKNTFPPPDMDLQIICRDMLYSPFRYDEEEGYFIPSGYFQWDEIDDEWITYWRLLPEAPFNWLNNQWQKIDYNDQNTWIPKNGMNFLAIGIQRIGDSDLEIRIVRWSHALSTYITKRASVPEFCNITAFIFWIPLPSNYDNT